MAVQTPEFDYVNRVVQFRAISRSVLTTGDFGRNNLTGKKEEVMLRVWKYAWYLCIHYRDVTFVVDLA